MFGWGSSEEPKQVEPQGISAKDEEMLSMAGSIIAMSACEREVMALQQCTEANNLSPNTSQAQLTSLCGRELEGLSSCAQRVDETAITQAMFEFSATACPMEFQRVQDCQANKGGENCQQEFLDAMICGATQIVEQVQRSAQF